VAPPITTAEVFLSFHKSTSAAARSVHGAGSGGETTTCISIKLLDQGNSEYNVLSTDKGGKEYLSQHIK
jgi:hypothetical protein